VARGIPDVLQALLAGTVAELILGPDPGVFVSRCSGCRHLFLQDLATCPRCSQACSRVNLWQEILARALSHGIPVHFMKRDARLDSLEGLAALLTRNTAAGSARPAESARMNVAS